MRGIRSRRLSVLALTGVVVVGGCGLGGTGDGAGSGTASATEPVPTTASVTPTPAASASDEPPTGSTWATSSGTGVRFAVPEEWSVYDPSALVDEGDPDALAEAADALGISPDEMGEVAEQVDLLVMGQPEGDFAPNVNVVPSPVAEMPGDAALAADLESIGAEVGDVRAATSPLGDAKVVEYELAMGPTTVHGRAIVAETPDGFATITVSHVSDKGADAIAEQVLATLGAA